MTVYRKTLIGSAIAALSLTLTAGSAMAQPGEVRVGANYGFGEQTLENDFGDELSADMTELGFNATYFGDESGPLIGARYAKLTADGYELNGESLDWGSDDGDILGIRAGYRGGRYGQAQPVIFAFANRVDPDEGTSSTSIGLAAGIEQSTEQFRFDLGGSYADDDDGHTITLGTDLVLFATEEVGFLLGASYSFGETEFWNEEVDTEGYQLRVGVELRFR